MVDGFTDKDGKFRPIDRSPLGKGGLSVREALPKETDEDKKRQSERLGKFALSKAKQFAKITGRLVQSGAKEAVARAEIAKARKVEKGIIEQEFVGRLDKEINQILDAPSSDSTKFRMLQAFGDLERNNLSKRQLNLVNQTLEELDIRIKKRLKAEAGGMTKPREEGVEGVTPIEKLGTQEFQKLPEPQQEKIKTEVAGE